MNMPTLSLTSLPWIRNFLCLESRDFNWTCRHWTYNLCLLHNPFKQSHPHVSFQKTLLKPGCLHTRSLSSWIPWILDPLSFWGKKELDHALARMYSNAMHSESFWFQRCATGEHIYKHGRVMPTSTQYRKVHKSYCTNKAEKILISYSCSHV